MRGHDLTCEVHSGFHPKLPRGLLKFRAQRPFAYQDHVEARVQMCCGSKEQGMVLHRTQSGNHADGERTVGETQGPALGDPLYVVDRIECALVQKVWDLNDFLQT